MTERTEHGFRIGAIEARADFETPQHGSAITVIAGDVEIAIQATAKGRKAWINVKAVGKTVVSASLRDETGWTNWP